MGWLVWISMDSFFLQLDTMILWLICHILKLDRIISWCNLNYHIQTFRARNRSLCHHLVSFGIQNASRSNYAVWVATYHPNYKSYLQILFTSHNGMNKPIRETCCRSCSISSQGTPYYSYLVWNAEQHARYFLGAWHCDESFGKSIAINCTKHVQPWEEAFHWDLISSW